MTTRQELFLLAEDLGNEGFDKLAYELKYISEYKDVRTVIRLLEILRPKK